MQLRLDVADAQQVFGSIVGSERFLLSSLR